MTQITAPYSPSASRSFADFSGVRVSFIQIFCWAQLAMVVMNLGRIPVLNTADREFPIAFNEICLGVILVAAAMTIRSWKTVFVDRISVTALVFALIGAGSAVWSLERFDMGPIGLLVSLAYLGRWVMYFTLYVALINVLREADIESAWNAVETMLVIFSLFGLVQTAFLPNLPGLIYKDNRSFNWDMQGHRLISSVMEPNIAGTMLMMGMLVQFSRITTGVRVSWQKMLIMFAALVLTISRSAVFGMIFGLMVMLVATRGVSRRLLKVAAAFGAITLVVSPFLIQYLLLYQKFRFDSNSSAGARLIVWIQTLKILRDYPVFGVGFNAYRYALGHYGFKVIGASSYAAEGGLLFVAAMTGFVGLTVYCGMVWLLIRRCRSIWRDTSVPANQRGIALGTAAATVGVIFASTFVNALLTTFVMELMWVLWALTFVIDRARARRNAPPASPSAVVVALA
jgi:hypothetical protein